MLWNMALPVLLELPWVLPQQAQVWVLLASHQLDQWLTPMPPPTCLRQGPLKLVSPLPLCILKAAVATYPHRRRADPHANLAARGNHIRKFVSMHRHLL